MNFERESGGGWGQTFFFLMILVNTSFILWIVKTLSSSASSSEQPYWAYKNIWYLKYSLHFRYSILWALTLHNLWLWGSDHIVKDYLACVIVIFTLVVCAHTCTVQRLWKWNCTIIQSNCMTKYFNIYHWQWTS